MLAHARSAGQGRWSSWQEDTERSSTSGVRPPCCGSRRRMTTCRAPSRALANKASGHRGRASPIAGAADHRRHARAMFVLLRPRPRRAPGNDPWRSPAVGGGRSALGPHRIGHQRIRGHVWAPAVRKNRSQRAVAATTSAEAVGRGRVGGSPPGCTRRPMVCSHEAGDQGRPGDRPANGERRSHAGRGDQEELRLRR
jgi:hypothetical protein